MGDLLDVDLGLESAAKKQQQQNEQMVILDTVERSEGLRGGNANVGHPVSIEGDIIKEIGEPY